MGLFKWMEDGADLRFCVDLYVDLHDVSNGVYDRAKLLKEVVSNPDDER